MPLTAGRTRPRRQPTRRSQERPLRELWRSLVIFDLALVWRADGERVLQSLCKVIFVPTPLDIVISIPPHWQTSFRLQNEVRRWPLWMKRDLKSVISHHPLRDISMVTWSAFLVGCNRFGFHFFWACCTNLLLAGFFRLLVAAPRPFMYDQRLRPLTDRYETSYGFPSLETHMATVVSGWWVENAGMKGGGQMLARLLAVVYICFIGFTRVYSCSRFVHQVLLSAITGAVGLALGWRLSMHLDDLDLLVRHHIRGTIVVLVVALGFISYHVENNSSNIMGIKKQEYVRVLANIVNKSRHAQKNAMIGTSESDGGDSVWEMDGDIPPEALAIPSNRRRRHLPEDRRDSFFFLHKTIQGRAAEKATIKRNAGMRHKTSAGQEDESGDDDETTKLGDYGGRRGAARARYG